MKREIEILSIFLLLPFVAYGQNKLSIGFTINSELSKMKIAPPGYWADDLNEYGDVAIGYSGGLQIQYKLTELLFIESGIIYQKMKHRYRMDGLRFPDSLSVKVKNIQNDILLSSIGIPMKLGHYFNRNEGKINYYSGIFSIINFNVSKSSEALLIDESTNESQKINAVNQIDESFYSIGVFGGFDTKVGNKIFMGLELNLRYTPNRFVLDIYESNAKTLLETGITLKIRIL